MQANRICTIKGCGKAHRARGWCSTHYCRWLNTGDPLGFKVRSKEKQTWTKKIRPVKIVGPDCFITLSDGTTAVCDAEDADLVRGNNWSLGAGNHPISGLGKLAHVILGRSCHWIDHKDRDARNNRKSNLRYATKQENAWNRSKAKGKSSQFKGVSFRSDRGTWMACIGFNGRTIKLGTFATEREAAEAYDNAARERFGEFAALNFPEAKSTEAAA